jgi:hypothetical protein
MGNRAPTDHKARPDHFFAAVEHGFELMEAGLSIAILGVMARGAQARGLVDASAGYDHARLTMTTLPDSAPSPASEQLNLFEMP